MRANSLFDFFRVQQQVFSLCKRPPVFVSDQPRYPLSSGANGITASISGLGQDIPLRQQPHAAQFKLLEGFFGIIPMASLPIAQPAQSASDCAVFLLIFPGTREKRSRPTGSFSFSAPAFFLSASWANRACSNSARQWFKLLAGFLRLLFVVLQAGSSRPRFVAPYAGDFRANAGSAVRYAQFPHWQHKARPAPDAGVAHCIVLSTLFFQVVFCGPQARGFNFQSGLHRLELFFRMGTLRGSLLFAGTPQKILRRLQLGFHLFEPAGHLGLLFQAR